MKIFNNFINRLADLTAGKVDELIESRFTETNQSLRKIEAAQKETSIQLEEIDSYLQGDNDETVFINTIIELADIIEDFYHYTAENKDSPLFEQAQMMRNTAKNKAEKAGLIIIESTEEPFDFNLHSIHSTAYDENIPEGYVIKTIKCGFIYKDEVIRTAAVIVNKQNKQIDEEQKPEVIYL